MKIMGCNLTPSRNKLVLKLSTHNRASDRARQAHQESQRCEGCSLSLQVEGNITTVALSLLDNVFHSIQEAIAETESFFSNRLLHPGAHKSFIIDPSSQQLSDYNLCSQQTQNVFTHRLVLAVLLVLNEISAGIYTSLLLHSFCCHKIIYLLMLKYTCNFFTFLFNLFSCTLRWTGVH